MSDASLKKVLDLIGSHVEFCVPSSLADDELLRGFIAAASGESILDRQFDDTSHYWKQGWRACKTLRDKS